MKKIDKLVMVSRMYYEDNMTQNEIARAMHLSRPLISKFLSEAREMGIVKIEIKPPFESDNFILSLLKEKFSIQGGGLIVPANQASVTESLIAKSAFQFLMENLYDGCRLGLSWGNMIGRVAELVKELPGELGYRGEISSLLGNSNTANKNYHTDALCRTIGEKTGLTPCYIHAPAFLESRDELNFFARMEVYKSISAHWNQIDFAVINVENHPSVPDLATASRFGDQLAANKAVGHMVSYYYNIEGNIIESKNDIVVRIPLEALKKARIVMGVCHSNVNIATLLGILRTGLLTHIFVNESIAAEAVKTG